MATDYLWIGNPDLNAVQGFASGKNTAVKLQSLRFRQFKRFTDLTIQEVPETARLVVMIGPNGSGKTSLFEGLNYISTVRSSRGQNPDKNYHWKTGSYDASQNIYDLTNKLEVNLYSPPTDETGWKKAFYLRTAYRHEATFENRSVNEIGEPLDDRQRPQKLINVETRVSDNYQRLLGLVIKEVFLSPDRKRSIEEVSDKLIGEVRNSMSRVFDQLLLQGVGDPFTDGTFYFEKGMSSGYRYLNLSGGEKAAFDLLLDFVVKKEFFDDTIYCIDEPELHMHTRLQATLLNELYDLIPDRCQLWIATHSIGMMRRAMELHQQDPSRVVFLDFENHNFDESVCIKPTKPGRQLWKRVFAVSLDELGELVAPEQVIFCEGKPIHQSTQRAPTFDAEVYRIIFEITKPNTEFIPLGGSTEVEKNSIILNSIFTELFKNMRIWRLFDRDDRTEEEITRLNTEGISVLNRRDIENYLWDDEVIEKLCVQEGKPEAARELVDRKNVLIAGLAAQGKMSDDVKKISGKLYDDTKKRLQLTQRGNNSQEFAKHNLAPLITPDTAVYQQLQEEIFGPLERRQRIS